MRRLLGGTRPEANSRADRVENAVAGQGVWPISRAGHDNLPIVGRGWSRWSPINGGPRLLLRNVPIGGLHRQDRRLRCRQLSGALLASLPPSWLPRASDSCAPVRVVYQRGKPKRLPRDRGPVFSHHPLSSFLHSAPSPDQPSLATLTEGPA